ncbi:unnamed protein product [Boreogadus saida]
MSDSGSGNSWTLLSQEENVATLRPLAEGTELLGDGKSQPTEVAITAKTEHPSENQQASEENMSGQFEGEASPCIAQSPSPTTAPTTTPTSDPSSTLIPTIEIPPPPPSLVIPAHSLHGRDAHSQSEGLPEGPVESRPDPDSFSDSYTHISTSSSHEPRIPELLGGLELTEEDEDADRPGSEGEGSEQGPSQPGSSVDPEVGEERGPEIRGAKGDAEGRRGTLLASLEQIGRREEEEPEEEFQLPRRNDDSGFSVNKCILGAVILLGLGTIFLSGVFMDLDEDSNYAPRDLREAEKPVKQEWPKPEAPQAAVDEGMDILNKLVKETQQIAALQAKTQEEELNAARGRAAEGAQEQLRGSQKVEVVVEENVHEAALLHPVKATTAPLGGQEGESSPATSSTEGQTKKPLHVGREGEKTDSRERGKTERKDEEWKKPNHDQQERSKEVKGRKKKEEGREGKEKGHIGDIREPWRERGDGKELREKAERNAQKEEKKWKNGKHEKSDSDRVEERKGHDKEKKKEKERGDRKEWVGRDGERNNRKEENQWKRGKEEKEGKKGKDERKDRKEEREWKKGKSEKLDNDREKESRGREEKKYGTGSKEHGKRTQEKEDWKGEKEWKKGKDAYKESSKEWKEKKEGREKGEQKDWKKDTNRRSKDDKDQRREKQGREERRSEEGREGRKPLEGKEERRRGEGKEARRPWEGKEERRHGERRHGENRERHDEGKTKREAWKEERKDVDGKQDRKINSVREEDVDHKKQEHHRHNQYHEESLWQAPGDGRPTHTRRRPSFGQPDYWVHQRQRLRQNRLPSRHCASVEDCARFEGTLPVQLTEFEALLEGYLAKAEQGAGVDTSAGEEIRTLAAEFFKDGVFVHDQMSFRDYLEDLADILEDMVDGDDSEEDQEEDDSDLEDEMEMFGKEVMKWFAVERSSVKTSQHTTGKSKKENARGRG